MTIRTFKSSDSDYLSWINGDGESGFVANIRDTREEYVMLHRARCGAIRNRLRDGYTYTETGREKIWSELLSELEAWANTNIRPTKANAALEILRCDCLDE